MPAASATLVMVISSLLFAVMAVLAKAASARLPGTEVALVRFIVGILAVATVAFFRPLRAKNWLALVGRGAFGGAAVLFYFLAIEHLPVGLATLLNYTAPVFTAIWAALFLGEPLDTKAVLALFTATLGVVLVTQGRAHGAAEAHWILIGAISALLSGAAVAMIRLVRRTDGAWETFGSFCLFGALINAPPALHGWVAPNTRDVALLLAVGVTSVAAQMGMTWALRYLRAAPAGVITQLTPVGALALGFVVYGDRISSVSAVGAALTLSAVSFDAWRITRPDTPPENP